MSTETVGLTESASPLAPDSPLLAEHRPVALADDDLAKIRETEDATAEEQTDEIYEIYSPENLTWAKMDKAVLSWMVLMHVGALAAPFFFSWTALFVCLGLHWLTCSIGICLGYHRYLSHRSFKLKNPSEFLVMLAGIVSGEGTPLSWVTNHRLHHQRSDQKGDPHSPNDGPWYSHLLWFLPKMTEEEQEKMYNRYAPELKDRPILKFFERTYSLWVFGMIPVFFGIGYLWNGFFGGMSLLVWGVCLRMIISYHSTWFVNSATHIWGYRNYETRDLSKNLWWVAVLSYGEGWHNNHHAHPSVAPAGHRWFEVDPTWWSIKFLRFIGQATDVKDQLPERKPVTTKS